MLGLLKIMHVDDDQDWQQTEYYHNALAATRQNPVPTLGLLPFITPRVPALGSNTMSTFHARLIKIESGSKTIIETNALSLTGLNKVAGTLYDYWYFDATDEKLGMQTGLYEFYLKDDELNEWISEPFYVINDCDPYALLGDFFPGDLNDDFFKTVT
jgi:hypothetical protein